MVPEKQSWRFDDLAVWRERADEWSGAPRLADDPEAGHVLEFDGTSDAFVIAGNPLEDAPAFSIEVRLRPASGGPEEQRFLHVQCDGAPDRALLELRSTPAGWYGDVFLEIDGRERFLNDPALLHPFDRWATLKLVYNGSELAQFVDGREELRASAGPGALGPGRVSVGRRINGVSPFRGRIAWVEFVRSA